MGLNTNMRRARASAWLQRLAVVLVAGVLVACGGGSGGDKPFGGPVTDGGGGGTPTPTAADLSLSLSAASLANNGVNTITATATAVDSNRNALASIPVTLSVDQDATLIPSGTATNSSGVVTGVVGIGANRSNRTVTVTAVSGSLTRTASFVVQGASLAARVNPAVLAPSGKGEVEFVLTDSSNNPMSGQPITVTGVGAVNTSGTTGLSGEFKYSYTAPTSSTALNIRADAGGTSTTATVLVQADSSTVPSANLVVRSASLAANPSVVAVNSAGTQNRVELRALFLTDGNAPVPNVRVRFDLDGDRQAIGGVIASSGNYVYSDSSGVATSSYAPGSRFSPTNGVTIRACWSNTDFAAGTCPNQALTNLTVISDALSVTVGSDDRIAEGASGLDYVNRFLVQVNDSSGLAKADVQISPSVDLRFYLKGNWILGVDSWFQAVRDECPNEDVNRNGVSEVFADGSKEDANNSFSVELGRPALDPHKAAVVVSFEGGTRTNAAGQLVLRLTYPKSIASWIRYNLRVAASGVAGTEGRANSEGVLSVPAAVVNNVDATPAFVTSPYGTQSGSPRVAVTDPATGRTEQLCTSRN